MAPQSGVPLECIKCITSSQRAGRGPSHPISPPVPLSFSVTSLLPLLTLHYGWQAWLLPVTAEVGEVLRYQGTAGLTNAWHPSALSGGKSAVPPGEGLRYRWFRTQRSVRSFHSFKSHQAAQRWGKPAHSCVGRVAGSPGSGTFGRAKQGALPLAHVQNGNILHLLMNLCLEDRKILLLKQGNSTMRNRVWTEKMKSPPSF